MFRSLLVVDPAERTDADAVLRSGAGALALNATAQDFTGLRSNSCDHAGPVLLACLGADYAEPDVAARMALRPQGLILSGFRDALELQRLGAALAVQEAERDLPDGTTRILAAVEDAAGLATLFNGPQDFAACRRLAGFTWDAAHLAPSLGMAWPVPWADPAAHPLLLARSMVLTIARALGVPAYDTAEPDGASLHAACDTARRMGYAGKTTRVARDIPTIEAVFGGSDP